MYFFAKQISKAYFRVLYSYDGCCCHCKSGVSANSRGQDGGGGSAGKSGVLSGISFFAAVYNPGHCRFVKNSYSGSCQGALHLHLLYHISGSFLRWTRGLVLPQCGDGDS